MTQQEIDSLKEQFRKDVASIRAEVRRRGGISQKTIADAIQRYRRQVKEKSGQ